MKELTSRQKQAITTKRKIRETAKLLLQKESFEKLTMNQVATEAGISVGTLYHYFNSKEELFFSIYHSFDEMISALSDQISFDSHIEAIRSIVYAQTVGALETGANYMPNLLCFQLASTGSSMFYDDNRAFPRYVFKHAEEAVSAGELIAPLGFADIATSVLRIARGCIFDCAVRKDHQSIRTLLEHDLNILLSHYRPSYQPDFPPIDPSWYNATIHWLEEN